MTAQILRLADHRPEAATDAGHASLLAACRKLAASFEALEQRAAALERRMDGLKRDARSVLAARTAVADSAVALRDVQPFGRRLSA